MKKTQKKSNKVEVVFVLDRSGSMEDAVSDTIGGFNSMIKKQQKESPNALVTTVLFDDKIEILHDRVKIEDVPTLTEKEYYARGCTSLLDAVGSTIKHISNIHKYARKDDVPAKTLFVITTDGYENSSREYTFQKVKKMIEKQREKYGWEFLFLGANIDAIAEASKIGIGSKYAANVMNDEEGVSVFYQSVSDAVCCCCAAPEEELPENWKEKIDKDYRKRKKSLSKSEDDNDVPTFLKKK